MRKEFFVFVQKDSILTEFSALRNVNRIFVNRIIHHSELQKDTCFGILGLFCVEESKEKTVTRRCRHLGMIAGGTGKECTHGAFLPKNFIKCHVLVQ